MRPHFYETRRNVIPMESATLNIHNATITKRIDALPQPLPNVIEMLTLKGKFLLFPALPVEHTHTHTYIYSLLHSLLTFRSLLFSL